MWLLYGLGLSGAGVLLLAYATRRNNAPAPPGWLRRGWVQQIIVFIVMVFFTFGGAALINVIVNISDQSMDIWQAIGIIVVIGAFVVLWRMIMKIPSPVPTAAAE
jgi:hypothetical protein